MPNAQPCFSVCMLLTNHRDSQVLQGCRDMRAYAHIFWRWDKPKSEIPFIFCRLAFTAGATGSVALAVAAVGRYCNSQSKERTLQLNKILSHFALRPYPDVVVSCLLTSQHCLLTVLLMKCSAHCMPGLSNKSCPSCKPWRAGLF
jgi:hypothetical protein